MGGLETNRNLAPVALQKSDWIFWLRDYRQEVIGGPNWLIDRTFKVPF